MSDLLFKATKAWPEPGGSKRGDEEMQDGANDSRYPLQPSLELLEQLVPHNKRQQHRTGFLGIFGSKVDTIDYCKVIFQSQLMSSIVRPTYTYLMKAEIARLNARIAEERQKISQDSFLGCVFICCKLQMGAHVLAQCVSYHEVGP
jgi:calcium permeable stress-gated cation channel